MVVGLVVLFASVPAWMFVGSSVDKATLLVTCEEPYFNGAALKANATASGTYIYAPGGVHLIYPPSVKCEIRYQDK